MKKILVTGGCGFVGRHLIDFLLKNSDNQVYCIDNLSSRGSHVKEWWLYNNRFTFYQADCLDFFREEDEEFDEIYHLAAIVGGRAKIDYYPLEVAQDLAIDSLMFNWAYRHVSEIVYYFSSSAVYPVRFQTPESMTKLREEFVDFNDDSFYLPDQSYGWAKLTGEYLAHKFAKETGKLVIIFRPFSGFGEDQSLDYPIPSLARKVISALRNGLDEVEVWGTGKQVRDFVYIDDVVNIVFKAPFVADTNPFTINIGTGKGLSFADVINIFGYILKKNFKIKPLTNKPEGVFYRVADETKLSKYHLSIPFSNSISGLEKVLQFMEVNYDYES